MRSRLLSQDVPGRRLHRNQLPAALSSRVLAAQVDAHVQLLSVSDNHQRSLLLEVRVSRLCATARQPDRFHHLSVLVLQLGQSARLLRPLGLRGVRGAGRDHARLADWPGRRPLALVSRHELAQLCGNRRARRAHPYQHVDEKDQANHGKDYRNTGSTATYEHSAHNLNALIITPKDVLFIYK